MPASVYEFHQPGEEPLRLAPHILTFAQALAALGRLSHDLAEPGETTSLSQNGVIVERFTVPGRVAVSA